MPTRYAPVRHVMTPKDHPSDLHALGTPPALILSQDQTLHQCRRSGYLSCWWPRTTRLCCCCCACSSDSVRAAASRRTPFAHGSLAPSLAHDAPRRHPRHREPAPRLRASLSTCIPSWRANIRLGRRRLLLRHHPRPPVPLRGSLFSEPAEPTAPHAPLSRERGAGRHRPRTSVSPRSAHPVKPGTEGVRKPLEEPHHSIMAISLCQAYRRDPIQHRDAAAPSWVRASGMRTIPAA